MKFYIYTLGCKVNTYESNVMRDKLLNTGYVEGTELDSDIYIINTCTVTNTSDNKSLKMVRRVIKNKPNSIIEKLENNKNDKIEKVLIIPLLKENKMDLILQKSTELGVNKIIPVIMERSIIKLDKDKELKKIEKSIFILYYFLI